MKRTNIKKLALRSTTIKQISVDGLPGAAGASGAVRFCAASAACPTPNNSCACITGPVGCPSGVTFSCNAC
jgi:hypothetical protein